MSQTIQETRLTPTEVTILSALPDIGTAYCLEIQGYEVIGEKHAQYENNATLQIGMISLVKDAPLV